MVNLADLDTSFLVPCRHCGDLLPEQDRICPHCGKDQALTLGPDGAEAVPGAHGVPPGDGDVLDSTFMARGGNDFARTGIGAVDVDDGPARRRRKAIGIVALIAGVLLLGMAWDQYRKQSPSTPSSSPPSASSAPAQDAPRTQAQPSTATGPVVRTPSAPASAAVPPAPAPVATAAAPPVAAAPPPTSARATPPAPPAPSAPSLTPARTAASPAPTPTPTPSPARTSTPAPPASSAPAGTTEAARPACDEALAAMSLCKP